ncbi:MAG: long-chain-fatty-acid--CoA ligase [Pseudomonadota bacterium]
MLFHDIFEHQGGSMPDRVALVDATRQWTYAEANSEANRIANALLGAGLTKGDRFGYLSKNTADMLMMYMAASRIGVVPVPLNYRLAPPEWSFIIANAGVKLLIAQDEYVNGIDKVRTELPSVEHWFALAPGAAPANAPPAGWADYRTWVAGASPTKPQADVAPGDVFYQMYTSGTTGLPKGVLVTHANYASCILQTSASFETLPASGRRALIIPPIYHAGALFVTAFALARGLSLNIMADFDPHAVVDTIEREDIVFLFMVPAMIQACLTQVPEVDSRDFSSLESIIYGASPIAEETLRRAMAVLQCDFYQGYGLTETTAILTVLGAEEHRRALKGEAHLLLAAGRPVAGTDLQLFDEHDKPVAQGEIGEIVAKGPQIMAGYWDRPEATEKAMAAGYFHTGDAGSLDAEGYVYIRDRIKDMVVSGGENVYPREIENVLFDHPQLVDAAVIGIPDAKFGERVMAFVVPKSGETIDAEAMIAWCRERLAGYKIPRQIEVIAELPRNASGKVLKRELRAPFWEGKERQVG